MNLTWHIVRHDLVRMRGWITCWVGVLLLPIGIGALLLAGSPLPAFGNESRTFEILMGLQAVMGYLLTVLLVHEHGLVGTGHFWLTRPISRGRLLGAKAIGAVAIVGVVPVLVALPWWAWCGFGVGELAQAALETIAVMAVVIVAGAFVAALTDSFARAMLWTVVLVAAGLSVMTITAFAAAVDLLGQRARAVLISRCVASVVVVTVVLAAVVVVQFFLRRRGWWLAVAGGVLVAAFLAANRWPWPWVPDVPRERNPERAPELTVALERVKARPLRVSENTRPEERWQDVDTYFRVSGVPANMSWSMIGARQRWSWGNDRTVERKNRSFGGGGPDPLAAAGLRGAWDVKDPETEQFLEEIHRKSKFPRPTTEHVEGRASVQAFFPPSIVQRMQAEPPRYEAQVLLEAGTAKLEFEVPLTAGGWLPTGESRTKVQRVERNSITAMAMVVRTRPVLVRTLLRHAASSGGWFYADERRRAWSATLLAINRARGEAVTFDLGAAERSVVVNGVEIEWRRATAEAPRVVRQGKWVPRAEWMEGVMFGAVGFRKEVEVLRDVKVERLEIAK